MVSPPPPPLLDKDGRWNCSGVLANAPDVQSNYQRVAGLGSLPARNKLRYHSAAEGPHERCKKRCSKVARKVFRCAAAVPKNDCVSAALATLSAVGKLQKNSDTTLYSQIKVFLQRCAALFKRCKGNFLSNEPAWFGQLAEDLSSTITLT